MRRALLAALLLGSACLFRYHSPLLAANDDGVASALRTITARSISKHVDTLAADEFGGRAPGTNGEALTVAYLVKELQSYGLQPGNPDGTWVQNVPLQGTHSQARFELSLGDRRFLLTEPRDFFADSLRHTPTVDLVDAPFWFVGYGVDAMPQWDDYKNAALKGAVVLTLNGHPPYPGIFEPDVPNAFGTPRHKNQAASAHEAVARFSVFETRFGARSWADRQATAALEDMSLVAEANDSLTMTGEIETGVAIAMCQAAGLDLKALTARAAKPGFEPVKLGTVTIRLEQQVRDVVSHNVVALLPGSDPVLKNEVVIYTAHWDHLGTDPKREGDQIFNGAVDNATGTASLLAVAKAFGALKVAPKRSVLFLFTTAEERGLLGARYYLQHPLYPLEQTVADLNLDIMNYRGATRDVGIVGRGLNSLTDTFTELAKNDGRVVTDGPPAQLAIYFRSDHFEFALKHIPTLYLSIGRKMFSDPRGYGKLEPDQAYAERYHQVNDEVRADWDFAGAADDSRLLMQTGWQVAMEAGRPTWNSVTPP